MDWQTWAAAGTVVFAGVLMLRRLPWFAARKVAGCGGCHGCSAAGSSGSPRSLVQLGTTPAGVGKFEGK